MKVWEQINLTDEVVFQRLSILDNGNSRRVFLGRFAFLKIDGVWKFLFAKISDEEQFEEQSFEYPDFLFVSKALPNTTFSQIICDLNNGNFEVLSGLSLSKKLNGWKETLNPSCASNSNYSTRIFESRLIDTSQFDEKMLVGYGLPFHRSSGEFFQSWFGLDIFHGYSDGRLGSLQLELTDNRAKICFSLGELSVKSNEDICLTGFYIRNEEKVDVKLFKDEIRSMPEAEISEYQLFLVNKESEVLDYLSSSYLGQIQNLNSDDEDRAVSIRQAIESGESEHTEFKVYISLKDSSKAKEIEKTVCAFSNKFGGLLIIGVGDDGTIKGLTGVERDYKANMRLYLEAVRKRLTEKLRIANCYQADLIEVTGEQLLVVEVRKIEDCNYVLDDDIAYIRKGATSRKATPEECARLFKQKVVQGNQLYSISEEFYRPD